MKVRGSLEITKDLILRNTGDSSPANGLVAVSDSEGKVFWARINFPEVVSSEIYKLKGTPVMYQGKLYLSKVINANGLHIEDIEKWYPVEGVEQTKLTDDQIDAIEEANSPEAGNPFATLADITNFTIAGTDTSENILIKSSLIRGVLWLSSNSGVDSFSNQIVAGDGIVSTGAGWFNIGPFRGAKGDKGDTGDTGEKGDKGDPSGTFIYTQGTPAGTWLVAHNLNKYPSVTVVNSGKDTIESTVTYVDENNVVITVFPVTAGYAYIN